MKHGRDNLVLDVKAQIAAGRLAPGQRLPATREWARQYRISGPTAHKALQALEREGLVVRRPRSGTFVSGHARIRERAARDLSVAVVMDGHSHVFGKIQAHLLDELQAAEVAVSVVHWSAGAGAGHPLKALEEVLGTKPRAIVVQRDVVPLAEGLLRRAADTASRILVAASLSRHLPPGWCSVSPDLERMTYLAVRHLLDFGHRRIALLGFAREQKGAKGETWPSEAERGAWRAANEAGAPDAVSLHAMPHALTASQDPEDTVNWIRKTVLERKDRPTGLTAIMDWRAVLAMRAAQRLGLRIPDDLSIVGQWNTPWAEASDLTSVSVGEAAIAHRLAELCMESGGGAAGRGLHIQIEPELVQRHSSAAPPDGG